MSPRKKSTKLVKVSSTDLQPILERTLDNVREEVRDNPYLEEAIRVLPVGGYRSAIGSFWNAVVDDLRNKVIHRSLELFNKSVQLGRNIQTYEDFQNHVNDDQLIEGAYKIGVIGWEASKILRHAKETRHIFDGHSRSSSPSVVKVLAMFDDCARYVLSEPFPPQIIDIDDYLTQMGSEDFDRNDIAIENALAELPEIYKEELVNRLYTAYIHKDASTVLRGNIEYVSPFLWRGLPKKVKVQVVRRVDQEIAAGHKNKTALAFKFVDTVDGSRYLSQTARRYKLTPLVEELASNLDQWGVENKCVRELKPYAAYIPDELIPSYVKALVMTYVGYVGSSAQYNRTDFYADGAAIYIPDMVDAFDDNAAASFVYALKKNDRLRRRVQNPRKMARLRSLGNIVFENVSDRFQDLEFLELLVDPDEEEAFIKAMQ